jgi:regulator of sigma E protease
MEGMIMTAQLLMSLSILIVVHEGGHFLAARMFNIKVEKFYLFFDFLFPMANVLNFSLIKFKKGDTEYGVGWFPLGGYVKIAGMVDESMDKEQMKTEPQPWEFRTKPAWQRLIVMLGGIIVNVVLGIIIFIGMAWVLGDTYIPMKYINDNGGIHSLELGQQIGLQTGDKIIKVNGKEAVDFADLTKPDNLLSENSAYTVIRNGEEVNVPIPSNFIESFNKKEALMTFVSPRVLPIIEQIAPETIAEKAGLKRGDRVVEVYGTPVTYNDEVNQLVKSSTSDLLLLKVQRGDQIISVKEAFPTEEKRIGYAALGIDPKELAHINYGFGESLAIGPVRAFDVIFVQLKAFKKIFTGDISFRKSLSGPVGMAQAFGTQWDWERFWRMTGLLSMVLAFMNLLPIPALDGGYVMFLLYEMITGKEASEKFFETALKIGFAILIVLMVFVFYNDIAKLITGG